MRQIDEASPSLEVNSKELGPVLFKIFIDMMEHSENFQTQSWKEKAVYQMFVLPLEGPQQAGELSCQDYPEV